jgi:hypothetical protein
MAESPLGIVPPLAQKVSQSETNATQAEEEGWGGSDASGGTRSSTRGSTNAPFAVHAGEIAAVSSIGRQTHTSEEEEEEKEEEEKEKEDEVVVVEEEEEEEEVVVERDEEHEEMGGGFRALKRSE